MRIYVLDGAGTHGRHDNSVIAGGVDRLEGTLTRKHDPDTTAEWVPWQAALMGVGGNRESWDNNSREGVRLLVERMQSHDEDVILIAYSAGNKPAHDFLNDHPEFHDRVAAVGFVSDPWRPRDRWQHGLGDPGGWGVCGEDWTPIPARCFWTAVPGDVIPCAQPDSLLRYAADISGGDPDRIVHDMIEAATRGRFQLARFLGLPLHEWLVGLGRRLHEARMAVEGYLWLGHHTKHYVGPVNTGGGDLRSLLDRLMDSIAWGVAHTKEE